MIKNTLLLLLIFSMSIQIVSAKEFLIKLKPASKITTSNVEMQEGDYVDFIVSEDMYINSKKYIKKGEKATGVVTYIENNSLLAKPAKISIENIKIKNIHGEKITLNGAIQKAGNDHDEIMEFIFPFFPLVLLRGGEVQIKPDEDEFTLFLKENL